MDRISELPCIDRLVPLGGVFISPGQKQESKFAMRINLQCLHPCLDRVGVISRTQVMPTQMAADPYIQRIQFQRPPAFSQRLTEPPHGNEVMREPVMSLRVVSI